MFWQLNAAQDPNSGIEYESLSLFVHVYDADGIEDVDLIYLLQDSHELLWEVDAEEWRRLENGEEIWIGTNGIRMAEGTPFPRDLYRVIVIDRSGARSRDEIYINSNEIDLEQARFPRATVENGRILLEGGHSEVTFWFYDENGTLVKIFPVTESDIALSSLLNTREQETVRYFHVNAPDDSGGYGFIYGPVYLE